MDGELCVSLAFNNEDFRFLHLQEAGSRGRFPGFWSGPGPGQGRLHTRGEPRGDTECILDYEMKAQ
uniref:Uncharacterized protein n=1 Tax=Oryza brachyantha TaxID=4533 RepID=J3KU13_ORYBR